ncbi:FliA/WhiG family RNA polymerase sigma factor [Kribbella sp. NPDC023972]|uniref:FliA/WhiG family RNA polymerase sigma factor n=1 Tax=Kribbella sp. NPDC023972 TaxID=3154795 RepID=UPI0033F1A95A
MGRRSSETDLDEIWLEYKAKGAPEVRDRLILQYAPLVKYVAGRIRSGLPESVDQADLVSEGVIGLMDAIEKFEPERGLKFQTYAVPRIRGAIIDGLRAVDWVPRSVRDKLRDVERAQVALESRLGRSASDSEIADELGIPLRELRQIYARVTFTSLATVDELGVLDQLAPTATDALEDDETRAALMRCVRGLAERDRIIVALYYYEGLTLAEIGSVLQVTESRVSQLHTRATLALRAKLEAMAVI